MRSLALVDIAREWRPIQSAIISFKPLMIRVNSSSEARANRFPIFSTERVRIWLI